MGIGETPGTLLPLRVRCLSIHADYACRHSGACCQAGWPIPIDDVLRRRMTERTGETRAEATVSTLRACEFYETDTRLCAVHRTLGPEAKPSPCRHFPRIALLDRRGVSLTLSHFCPTAAGMLFRDDVPLAIVRDPSSFPAAGEYEGLDARGVMPPLLRPGMLWDFDGYDEWEARAVALFADVDLAPESALARLRCIAARVEAWRPGDSPLEAHVAAAFEDPSASSADTGTAASGWRGAEHVVNRYLAARLFASWVPYQADRLMALVDDLQEALAVLREQAARQDLLEAIRATDLRVVHRC